ncbi:hypothetical protein BESB_069420 [Besnoitia besnoiti]|uniref:Uncharacterized protein n=1 Tax=Besnoitia besnoiti TaxID=94643 RepID=A0A2A9MAI4_BESBE|nr:hypothetical protein BESB_069420 [Besnoitia besnoiti]PFH34909.1 hypothetical protein BESB_069420 [Besnoitia besnoiti]
MSLRLILLVSVSSLAITAACARHHAAPHALGKHVRGRAGCRDAVCSRFLQQIGSVTEGPLSPPAVEGAALAPAAPFPAPVIAEAQPAPTPAPVNLEDIETVQNQVAEKLKEADAIGSKLEEAVNELNKTAGANERKGVDYSTTLINPPHPAPEATIEAAAESVSPQSQSTPSLYTAPVVVLLSPEPSSMEKLEFARAIACRGKMNTAEMRAIRTAKLAEMAAIKGTTSAQLEEEIKDAEARLEESKASRHKLQEELRQITSNAAAGAASKADMVFLKDDLRLEDEKIKVILTKLQNMQDRLAKLRAKEAQAEGTFSARGAKQVRPLP